MEHILRYADIDTRRALGVYRRLPSNEFLFKPIPPESFRYWPEKKLIIYTNFYPEKYEFTVYRGVTRIDEFWSPCEITRTWKNQRGEYAFCLIYEDIPFRFDDIPVVQQCTS